MNLNALALVALAFLAPMPADAQQRAPDAQLRAPDATAGITVIGHATIRAVAKNVRFTAQVRGDADEASALEALRAAGVVDPVIGPSGNQITNALSVVRGTVRDASRAKLDGIGRAAIAYMVAHPGITVQSVSFAPVVGDCTSAVEGNARTAAFDDARRKSAAIAAAAGLTVTAVVAVAETGGCPLDDDRISYGPSSAPGFDIGTFTFSVTISETVTFAIVPAGGASRRAL